MFVIYTGWNGRNVHEHDLLLAVDAGDAAVLVFLDLSAALLDTIDHSILLRRLESTFGIRDLALKWIRSYITGRHQAVLIDGFTSALGVGTNCVHSLHYASLQTCSCFWS